MQPTPEKRPMTDRPKLQTPVVNDYQNPTFERRESAVRRLVDDLPILNLARTVPELAKNIPLLVREPLTAPERLRLLELYRVPVNGVVMAADNRRLRQTPISSSARQHIKEELLAIGYEMANGYKIIINDIIDRGRNPATEGSMLLALHRAMEQLRNALLQTYRIYRGVPPRHFLELHQLHLYADRLGIVQKEIPANSTPTNDATPEMVYLRAMLLAIADPFRLVDGAIEELYQFLGKHVQECRIQAGILGDKRSDGVFLIRSDSDLPPAIFGRAPLDRPGTAPYSLNTTALITLFNQTSESAKGGESLETYAKWLLPRLRIAWERAQPRRHVEKKARVAIGLEAACFLLSESGRTAMAPVADSYGIEVQELDSEDETPFTLEPWSIINESLNGFMLSHPEQSGLGVRVGDLMLVVLQTDGAQQPQPTIAIARWMGIKDHELQVGVEILPGQASPVTLHMHGAGGEMPGEGALYLPTIKQLKIPPTIVAPKGLHEPRRQLRIDTGNRQVAISCGEVLTATEYLDRFRFGRAAAG